MKLFVLTVGVLAITAIGYAQATASLFDGATVSAQSVKKDGDVFHFKGQVEVKVGGMRLVADEADANIRTHDVELRGNVHLQSAPQ